MVALVFSSCLFEALVLIHIGFAVGDLEINSIPRVVVATATRALRWAPTFARRSLGSRPPELAENFLEYSPDFPLPFPRKLRGMFPEYSRNIPHAFRQQLGLSSLAELA